MHRECDSMETFKSLTKDIDCDPQPGGHLYVAHRPKKVMKALEKEAKLLRDTFDYDAQILDAETVKRDYVGDQAAGAMHEPEGIGIHAGKLAFGYLRRREHFHC